MERYEIRLSGSGGQGLILAGKILAEAAAIYEGLNAVQTQSYGPEARGGASKAEVVISDTEIEYPKAIELDLLLSLTQESCMKYSSDLKEGGILIIDSSFVKDPPEGDYRVELHSSPPQSMPVSLSPRDRVTLMVEKTADDVSQYERRDQIGYRSCEEMVAKIERLEAGQEALHSAAEEPLTTTAD